MQRLGAGDAQLVGADPLDLGAHGDQAARQVAYLGLARGIAQHRLAVGEARRHQEVFGGADRDCRELDLRALQPSRHPGVDVAVDQIDLGAELCQPLEVQIDRPVADGAATGQ